MQPKAEQRSTGSPAYSSVAVPISEWQGFWEHAPRWWPRRFEDPSRELLRRVERGLRGRIQ